MTWTSAVVIIMMTGIYVTSMILFYRDCRSDIAIIRADTDSREHRLLTMIQKKDDQITALTESLARTEGKCYVPPSGTVPVHPPGPRAFATKPLPPHVTIPLKGA